jgi:hypothetical protein
MNGEMGRGGPVARMRAILRRVWLLALVSGAMLAFPAVFAAPASAQGLVSGAVEGRVFDESGRPMFGVTLTLTNRATGRRWIVRTDRGGRYNVSFLGAGSYDALFEQIGFLPERIENVVVAPGDRRDVSPRLAPAEGPVVTPRVSTANPGVAAAGATGPDRWLTGAGGVATMPLDANDILAVHATTSRSGVRHDTEGLPLRFSTLVIDGVPSAGRLRAFDVHTRAAAFPISFLSWAGLEPGSPDVEYPGNAGSFLVGSFRSGAGETRLDAYGDFGSDATAFGADDVASFTTYRAGGRLGGSIVRDTAGFMIGAEYSKSIAPFRSFWPADTGVASMVSAADRYALDLDGRALSGLETVERIAAFGRLDLRLGDDNTFSLRGSVASLPSTAFVSPWLERTMGSPSLETATEIYAATTLVSSGYDGALHNDLSLGFELSSQNRDLEGADPARVEPPETFAAASGLGFGSTVERIAESRTLSFYGRNTVHVNSNGHSIKAGIAVQFPSWNVTQNHPNASTFAYSTASTWGAAGSGYYVGSDATLAQREWSERRVMLFAQDAWKPIPDVEVMAGVRLSLMRNVDTTEIRLEDRWLNLSSLSNRQLEKDVFEIEPRFSLTWRPAGSNVIVHGSAQVDAQPILPATTSEILFRDGSYNIRRGFGAIPGWPVAPDTASARVEGPTLAMLGPSFQGPRTSRLSGSITAGFPGGIAVSASASYRKTEFLPVRRDLNLLGRAAATDQNGRPIYGTLRQEGSLLFADAESNRRFPEFDAVWGLQATGVSTYTGFTLTASAPITTTVGFHGSYTYSKTEDDWMTGLGDPSAQISPFPDSLAGTDWTNGRSNFDVPHRASVGVEVRVPGRFGPQISAIYRHQSGYPFTPGFRPGVDANGDGSFSNDPAFIDSNVAGTNELTASWSCLSDNVAGFAARNACRGPSIKALDGRLSIDVASTELLRANVVIDVLNAIASEDIIPDRAVYLVDPARQLNVSPNGRNVTVPLIVNPNFGRPLVRFTPERVVRLGLRVSW